MGQYKDKIESTQNKGKSVEQISKDKNTRSHIRNIAKQKEKRKKTDSLTHRQPKEQIKHLDDMFGVGLGATKERKKLSE